MSLQNLATELLIEIIKDLSLADLNSLLQTSRRLATLLTPEFRKISTTEANAAAALYCAAAVHASEDLVRLLLENGEGISVLKDTTSRIRCLHISPGKCSDDVVAFVRSQGPNLVLKDGVALHWAASKGRLALVKLLLENGASITMRDMRSSSTALHQACASPENNDKMIDFLLARGADITARDIEGNPVLNWAVRQDNHAAVKLLIERGVDVNYQSLNGKTALHFGASLENGAIVRLLLENGAQVNAKDFRGMTALHVAASCGQEAAVRLLLENGADINAQDGRQWSPLHLAAQGGVSRYENNRIISIRFSGGRRQNGSSG